MVKLGWHLLSSLNALWACIIISKYIQGNVVDLEKSRQYNLSPLWGGILKQKDILTLNKMNSIGNDPSINIWRDC